MNCGQVGHRCRAVLHSATWHVTGKRRRSWQARQGLSVSERLQPASRAYSPAPCHGVDPRRRSHLRLRADSRIYDGSTLARRDVAVVTINYRPGAFGFFNHPGLDRETPGSPANFGLLDQIAALRWVRSNIEAFGGDPARVTIDGQSAGAQSVLGLMASSLTAGLFSGASPKALTESRAIRAPRPKKRALRWSLRWGLRVPRPARLP